MLRNLMLCGVAVTMVACDSKRAGSPSAGSEPVPDPIKQAVPVEVSFNEDIQPVLSEYCYHCHGPDEGTREPKDLPLRLDLPDEAFALRDDGKPAIIKGNAEESSLVKLILSTDRDLIMPPPESHKTLPAEKIELIKRWIDQGAEYEAHWAFKPVEKPEPPAAGENWAANPIDRFVAQKLEASGMEPNPPEDPRRFHRKLSFDLTGLPPVPAETDAFVKAWAAGANTAVEAEADRMLATTASAEHFARHWLDAARYADTHGIHVDNYRAIWPYRDWVIRAFERNMPWDQFTTEQIAGDMLPERTLDQLVATGFSRCLATTGESGAIGEEYDAIYAKDRVETMSAIWLGLTTGCAACHDHKFDPISTKEFYSLTAFFRNTPMNPLDNNAEDHPPSVFVPIPEDREEWADVRAGIASVEGGIDGRAKEAKADFESWMAGGRRVPVRDEDPSLAIHLPMAESDGPLKGLVDGEPREWAVELERIDGLLGKAPLISGTTVELGGIGGFSRGDQITYGGFIRFDGDKPTGAVVARIDTDEAFRGWDLYLQEGRPVAHAVERWPDTATKILAKQPLKPGVWHHVMITFDGTLAGKEVFSMHVDGERVETTMEQNNVGANITNKVPLRLGSRSRDEARLGGRVALQDFRFYRRLLSPEEIKDIADDARIAYLLALPADRRSEEQTGILSNYYFSRFDGPTRELIARLDGLKARQAELRARGSMSLVMEEKKSKPFAHVLTRGVYSDKGEKVFPDTPAVLPPMASDAPKDRLGLAKWLNDPANPLPARVTMNRTWSYFFGNGIVESNADFGIMGTRPSHPKLLDWLAAEFVGSGWDYRHMLKLIATSATYRQSGKVNPEKLDKDPTNRLLARGPRVRMDAEPIRDLALAASGLLVDKAGGPPVKPYQPQGIWEAVAMPQSNTRNYEEDRGEGLYRRSIYTMWKRTAAPPTMEILNAPTRETFCVRRDLTNTPLQALALLNDPQFVEASRVIAAHAIGNTSDFGERLDFVTLRLLGRKFDQDEKAIVRKTLEESLAGFRERPEKAKELLGTGASKPPGNLDPPELAAWTLVASQVFNLDENITR
jgi:hypothetical protein